ncbi:MAG TPA: serine O-acetyltransferase EpsC [Gemmatimonas sp.]|nr:serine O-acetyltransferase EpsC [Gemmatimonas sp.]
MTTTWPDFLAALDAERAELPVVRPMRAMAEEFALRTLTLLFPQFARGERTVVTSVRADAVALESLLLEALEPLVPHAADVVNAFTSTLPDVHAALRDDVNAILAGDPAAESEEEVVLAYPGFLATAVHRFAHELYRLRVPVFPRVVSEWAHRETGIDIHPGATIGRSFAIDHGTGLVIGETSVIGDRVRVYQGVTLGALAVSKRLAHVKRHPTIGNDVVIYANATILGGNTFVGDGSIIGGNVWMTGSVPPRSIVQFSSRVEKRAPDDDGLEFHI